MSDLRELSDSVKQIYQEAQASFGEFQKQSGLHCLSGCGACCFNREVSASVLEMMPAAIALYDTGQADAFYQDLLTLEQEICVFYKGDNENRLKGYCSNYENRPSVCRSFGAAAMRDKYGNRVLSVCKYIKEGNLEKMKSVNFDNAPVIGEFALRISTLHPHYGRKVYPINKALQEALKIILNRFSFNEE